MTYRFLGAWYKGEIGLEAKAWKDGPPSDEGFVICRADMLAPLLTFLQKYWPQEFSQWLKTNGAEARFPPLQGYENKRIVFPIPSSDGVNAYLVELQNGRWACPCVGFSYRHHCSHIDRAREVESEQTTTR
jgi:hypothetical protein